MATLGELRTELRERKLVESSTDFYGDDALLTMLEEASREIAAALRFPKIVTTVTADSAGDVDLTVPSRLIDVESLSTSGLTIKRVPLQQVKFLQQLAATDWTRGYYFDPSVGGNILIGPATTATPSYQLEYVATAYAASVTTATEAWDGLYEEFHELIVLRAAVQAYEMGLEHDKAQYWMARYAQVLQEFARFLGMEAPPQEMRERATA